jgi:hypothetical protein
MNIGSSVDLAISDSSMGPKTDGKGALINAAINSADS